MSQQQDPWERLLNALRDPLWETLGIILLLVGLFFGSNRWLPLFVVALFALVFIYAYRVQLPRFLIAGRIRIFISGLTLSVMVIAASAVILLLLYPSGYVRISARLTGAGIPLTTFRTTVASFDGEDDATVQQGRGSVIVINNDGFDTDYRFSYSLPSEGYSYAGIGLTLNDPIDLTSYHSLILRVLFETDNAECGIYIKDAAHVASVPLIIRNNRNLPPGIVIRGEENWREITIPGSFTFYDKDKVLVDTHHFKEIGLLVVSEFASDHGVCTVQQVSLYP